MQYLFFSYRFFLYNSMLMFQLNNAQSAAASIDTYKAIIDNLEKDKWQLENKVVELQVAVETLRKGKPHTHSKVLTIALR